MKTRFLRRGAVLLAIAACTAETLPPKGQLMIVVSTNLAPPKDFDSFHLSIAEDGNPVPVHDTEYAMTGSQATKLPATLGIVVGTDPNRVVRITVEALRGGTVRVRREAIVRVPANRIASLPLPIDGLCIDSECPADANGKPQTCIAGSCQSAEVDVDALPDFSREAIFGGGTGNGDGTCFDTLECFTKGKVADKNVADCTVAKESGGAGFNVAVVQPTKSDGICAANACLIPLERDPFTGPIVTGWREAGDRVLLPKAICERSLPVMTTATCPTKSAPTCGAWSAVGGRPTASDASLPIDGSVIEAGLPSNVPQALTFSDADPREGFIKGSVVVTRAPDESGISGYRLYWADGPSKKLDPLVTLTKTGADLTHPLEGPMFAGASHLIAVSLAASGEIEPHVQTGPIDNFVHQAKINVSNEEMSVPETLVDGKNKRLLIVGFDQVASRNLPAMVRCMLDGSGCTYHNLSNGEDAGVNSHPAGAAIDQTNDKLLVVVERSGPGPLLYRCNLDGTGCEGGKDLGKPSPGTIPSATYRIQVLIDETNKKLVALLNGNSVGGIIYRCNLDGTGCTYGEYGNGVVAQAEPDMVIDKVAGKLLVVRPASANAVPFLFRCELDGSSCGVKDISAQNLEPSSSLSAAIDEENQKLIVVSYRTNIAKLQYYRCNPDGTACTTRELDNPPSQAPSRPHLRIDAVHKKIFVFGEAQGGFYQRCELDGTACTSTYTTTAYGALNSRAALHDGKFYVVGAAATVTGFDFATFSAY